MTYDSLGLISDDGNPLAATGSLRVISGKIYHIGDRDEHEAEKAVARVGAKRFKFRHLKRDKGQPIESARRGSNVVETALWRFSDDVRRRFLATRHADICSSLNGTLRLLMKRSRKESIYFDTTIYTTTQFLKTFSLVNIGYLVLKLRCREVAG